MADRLHMSVGNYSNIENDKTNITLARLEEIATILEVDYQQILNLTPSQIFNNYNYGNSSAGYQPNVNNYVPEELTKQLQVKDEQIKALTEQIKQLHALLEKALIGK